ncbi:unnamed protein product [Cercopithifilaria johnstoni]|uniref:Uncharacterized protein n=1 Tax=Cercopithifilaria johnstoni TaxID=2874296 RepID=A0A8J2PWE2_9BILA|nr:unnamed protein product [Cercopithifilaria johnstoni]
MALLTHLTNDQAWKGIHNYIRSVQAELDDVSPIQSLYQCHHGSGQPDRSVESTFTLACTTGARALHCHAIEGLKGGWKRGPCRSNWLPPFFSSFLLG